MSGGYLALRFALKFPSGLKGLVLGMFYEWPLLAGVPTWLYLANAFDSWPECSQSIHKWVGQLPPTERDAIEQARQTGDYKSPAYTLAEKLFSSRHIIRLNPLPAPVQESNNWQKIDDTVYCTLLNSRSDFPIEPLFLLRLLHVSLRFSYAKLSLASFSKWSKVRVRLNAFI